MRLKKRIGVDFDNTIIDYDRVFRTVAVAECLVDRRIAGGKQEVRAAIRELPNGELVWQKLQGRVYGRWIGDAVMFDGVEAFLRQCRSAGHEVMIVSHKTEYGHFDPERVNLRDAARGWMRERGFFEPEGLGVPADAVHFETTRADKLARIGALGCTHFIDDLPEVLDDPDFPPNVSKILFTNGATVEPRQPHAYASWHEIASALLS